MNILTDVPYNCLNAPHDKWNQDLVNHFIQFSQSVLSEHGVVYTFHNNKHSSMFEESFRDQTEFSVPKNCFHRWVYPVGYQKVFSF